MSTAENPWKAALIEKLVVSHIYQAVHEDDPEKALNDLLNWEIQVALDPAVSEPAAALLGAKKDHVVISKALHEMWLKELDLMHRLFDQQDVPRQWHDVQLSVSQRLIWMLQAKREVEAVMKAAKGPQ